MLSVILLHSLAETLCDDWICLYFQFRNKFCEFDFMYGVFGQTREEVL